MKSSIERLEAGGVTLVWGSKAAGKAALREESLQRHLARPLAERLRVALGLVEHADDEDVS